MRPEPDGRVSRPCSSWWKGYPTPPDGTRGRLLAEINGLARRTPDRQTGGVTLATLHRAKGLEWDVVFVVGVTDGAIPSSYANTPAEQRRGGTATARRRYPGPPTAPPDLGRGQRPGVDATGPARSSNSSLRAQCPPENVARVDKSAPARRQDATRAEASSRDTSCGHCAAPLKSGAARSLGVCADCALAAPGDLGRRARAIGQIALDAADTTRDGPQQLVSPDGMLRLLDRRPGSGADVSATPGVRLTGKWARAVVEALKH